MLEEEEMTVPLIDFNSFEWKDIQPITQNDGPQPVVSIAYTPQFSQTMDYFRAILLKDEKSERALKLTTQVIDMNAANYTAWHFRRLCLFALNKDLAQELKFAADISRENPKNYQIWYHRRLLIDRLGDPLNELQHTADLLKNDSKNYHVWSHRQWVVQRFHLWNEEIEFTHSLLQDDMRNNSAWNYRHFIVKHTLLQDNSHVSSPSSSSEEAKQQSQHQLIESEVEYTQNSIKQVVDNESAWNYLRGLMQLDSLIQSKIEVFIQSVIQQDPKATFAYVMQIELNAKSNQINQINQAIQSCELLSQSLDAVRSKYWQYQKQLLIAKQQNLTH